MSQDDGQGGRHNHTTPEALPIEGVIYCNRPAFASDIKR